MLAINAYFMLADIPIYIWAVQRYNKIRTSQRERAFFSAPLLLYSYFTELLQVVQERAEGPKAPSPGQHPGYSRSQQSAL